MTSVPVQKNVRADGLRPVNLRTDLAQLADLVELVVVEGHFVDIHDFRIERFVAFLQCINFSLDSLDFLLQFEHFRNTAVTQPQLVLQPYQQYKQDDDNQFQLILSV